MQWHGDSLGWFVIWRARIASLQTIVAHVKHKTAGILVRWSRPLIITFYSKCRESGSMINRAVSLFPIPFQPYTSTKRKEYWRRHQTPQMLPSVHIKSLRIPLPTRQNPYRKDAAGRSSRRIFYYALLSYESIVLSLVRHHSPILFLRYRIVSRDK
jgi:hypothetical protein